MNYHSFIAPETQFYHLTEPFVLESGEVLSGVQVAYRTWGTLNPTQDNAVLVCHALTGATDVDRWWEPLLGQGRSLNVDRDFIICSNILGSCYGTTGATSINSSTGKAYGATFPRITIRDMVRLQAVLLEALNVRSLKLVIGGSLGGMQVLEWAALYPEKVNAIAVIAASSRHSDWCIAISEAQRQAIYADPKWQDGNYSEQPAQGLAAARMMAMSFYRSWSSFNDRFGRQIEQNDFEIANYLRYQGQKFVDRFDANTYITLTHAMDSHHVTALEHIHQPALIVAISSDVLYPPVEQKELAALIPNATFAWLHSDQGHDAFLIDTIELNELIVQFRERLEDAIAPIKKHFRQSTLSRQYG
jgi:homoserine O-acetyltransferase/O-succinyltransferase